MLLRSLRNTCVGCQLLVPHRQRYHQVAVSRSSAWMDMTMLIKFKYNDVGALHLSSLLLLFLLLLLSIHLCCVNYCCYLPNYCLDALQLVESTYGESDVARTLASATSNKDNYCALEPKDDEDNRIHTRVNSLLLNS